MTLMENASPPAEGTIRTERRGPLLLVGIDRPAKRNGFTPRMFRELAQAYTLLDDDAELRVGVLHAFGDHFTAVAHDQCPAGRRGAGSSAPPAPPGCGRERACDNAPALRDRSTAALS